MKYIITGRMASGKRSLAKELESMGFEWVKTDGIFPLTVPDMDRDHVLILDPDGVKGLKLSGVDYVGIFLDLPEEILMRRALLRGDEPETITRKFIDDTDDYNSISLAKEDFFDIIVHQEIPVDALAKLVTEYKEPYQTFLERAYTSLGAITINRRNKTC